MRRQGTAILAGVALALLWLAPAARASGRCVGQDDPINAGNRARAERSLLCLVNIHRAEAGVDSVTMDGSLRSAARSHSVDMVATNYFSDDGGAGGPFDRAVAAGYPSDSVVEESIVLDPKATPYSLFSALVGSAHNENIVAPGWLTAGIGVAVGHPAAWNPQTRTQENAGPGGATATLLFGSARTRASDISVDLFVTPQCDDAHAQRKAASRRVRSDRHSLAVAATPQEEAEAKSRLRQDLQLLRRAREAIARACNPSSF
jgi:hypothetical protein